MNGSHPANSVKKISLSYCLSRLTSFFDNRSKGSKSRSLSSSFRGPSGRAAAARAAHSSGTASRTRQVGPERPQRTSSARTRSPGVHGVGEPSGKRIMAERRGEETFRADRDVRERSGLLLLRRRCFQSLSTSGFCFPRFRMSPTTRRPRPSLCTKWTTMGDCFPGRAPRSDDEAKLPHSHRRCHPESASGREGSPPRRPVVDDGQRRCRVSELERRQVRLLGDFDVNG